MPHKTGSGNHTVFSVPIKDAEGAHAIIEVGLDHGTVLVLLLIAGWLDCALLDKGTERAPALLARGLKSGLLGGLLAWWEQIIRAIKICGENLHYQLFAETRRQGEEEEEATTHTCHRKLCDCSDGRRLTIVEGKLTHRIFEDESNRGLQQKVDIMIWAAVWQSVAWQLGKWCARAWMPSTKWISVRAGLCMRKILSHAYAAKHCAGAC